MPPLVARNLRRNGRVRRGSIQGPIEALERREVLSYSALGFSLPDLAVTAYSAPIAAWGQPLTVATNIYNQGASSINQPLNLNQGAISTADSAATTLSVFASARPGRGKEVFIGSILVPAIDQNDVITGNGTFVLPAKPAGFPGAGGHIFLKYVVNGGRTFPEANFANNTFASNQPITIARALPNLQLVGFDVPGSLQPGDSLAPAIRIANNGAADTDLQGPLVVQIVASQNSTYGPGDAILATYIVNNVPALSTAPSTNGVAGDINLQPGNNIVTLGGQVITLPTMPSSYFLGVKINPLGSIQETGKHATPQFDAVVKVGPPIPGVPPTNFLLINGGTLNQFPFPLGAANSGITVGGATDLFTTSVGTRQTAAIQVANQTNLKAVSNPSQPLATSSVALVKLGTVSKPVNTVPTRTGSLTDPR